MPSETRVNDAVAALRGDLDAFRSALAEADEEVRSARSRGAGGADPAVRLKAELGPFAHGRIDAGRLATLLATEEEADPLADHLLEQAHRILGRATGESDEGIRVRLPAGGDLRDAVRDALARVGRVFGATRAVGKALARRYRPDEDHALLHDTPFHRWSPAERALAPPLVVSLDGHDLRAAGLSEYLDGRVKVVLVVEGSAPAAALARLIAHGVFVAQGDDPALMQRLAAHDGPGIVALTAAGSGAVPFVHDPAAGERTWARIALVDGLEGLRERLRDASRPGRPGTDVAELTHLLELATPPEGAVKPAPTEPTPTDDDTADRLAAWILARTDLGGL